MKTTQILIALLLTISLQAQSQKPTSIEGKMLTASDRPAYGIAVSLFDSEGNIITSDSTDRKGGFRLKTTEPGPYWLDVKSPDIRLSRHFILQDNGTSSSLTATISEAAEGPLGKSVTLSFKNRRLTEFTRIHKEASNVINHFYQAIMKHSSSAGNLDDFDPVDYTEKIEEIEGLIRAETDTEIKSALYIQYLALEGMKSIIQISDITKVLTINLDIGFVKEAYKRISPTSPIWAIDTNALEAILRMEPESYPQYKSYFEQVIENNPYEEVRTNLLFKLARFSKAQGLEADFANYFGILISSYPESGDALRAKATFEMATALTAGNSAPDFEINSLDNPEKMITKESLLGKVYLLEFWGLGCRGCIMEMPKLHKAYKKYKDRGFEILSVSLDGEKYINATQKFRKDKYPMPWLNAFAKGKFGSPMAKDYEVYAVPSPYLIDEEGNIIARGAALRGEGLVTILSEHLKKKR